MLRLTNLRLEVMVHILSRSLGPGQGIVQEVALREQLGCMAVLSGPTHSRQLQSAQIDGSLWGHFPEAIDHRMRVLRSESEGLKANRTKTQSSLFNFPPSPSLTHEITVPVPSK